MLIVVLYHCILYWNGSWFDGQPAFSAKPLGIAANWMNSFHIYAFALVSGYLFYALKYEQGKYTKFLPFVINKSKRLLIPYVFASLVWVIPFAAYFFRYDVGKIVWSFAFGTSPSQLWFLLMLFVVFVIFYPLSDFFKNHNLYGGMVVLAIYGVGILGSAVLPNVFQIFRACTYLPLFWLGFKVRQYGSLWLRRIPIGIWLVADILLFVLTQYLSEKSGALFSLITLGCNFLLHIVGALMAFVALQKLADLVQWKKRKVLKLLGQHSMSIYLFHQQAVYVFIVCLNGLLNPYLHAAVNFIGALSISLLISVFMAKFKITRIFIGQK